MTVSASPTSANVARARVGVVPRFGTRTSRRWSGALLSPLPASYSPILKSQGFGADAFDRLDHESVLSGRDAGRHRDDGVLREVRRREERPTPLGQHRLAQPTAPVVVGQQRDSRRFARRKRVFREIPLPDDGVWRLVHRRCRGCRRWVVRRRLVGRLVGVGLRRPETPGETRADGERTGDDCSAFHLRSLRHGVT
ncbi:hypothetical protein [Halorussus caseinilyticus]|uniref:Uncharacterized protein n=1 Tax=Halorussus caseinilyticus TaxID=3034025 RepID=A0ABD5WJZ0_9EURY